MPQPLRVEQRGKVACAAPGLARIDIVHVKAAAGPEPCLLPPAGLHFRDETRVFCLEQYPNSHPQPIRGRHSSLVQASRRAPAIIFLDELDALVPARAARAGGSDQIYASGRQA